MKYLMAYLIALPLIAAAYVFLIKRSKNNMNLKEEEP